MKMELDSLSCVDSVDEVPLVLEEKLNSRLSDFDGERLVWRGSRGKSRFAMLTTSAHVAPNTLTLASGGCPAVQEQTARPDIRSRVSI